MAAEDAVEVAVEAVAVVAEVPSPFPSSSSDYLLHVALDVFPLISLSFMAKLDRRDLFLLYFALDII